MHLIADGFLFCQNFIEFLYLFGYLGTTLIACGVCLLFQLRYLLLDGNFLLCGCRCCRTALTACASTTGTLQGIAVALELFTGIGCSLLYGLGIDGDALLYLRFPLRDGLCQFLLTLLFFGQKVTVKFTGDFRICTTLTVRNNLCRNLLSL
jgi:hypothetical protein